MDLLPCDLLFYPVTPRSAFLSKLVAIGELLMGRGNTTTQYSHVALVKNSTSVYEAAWPKTCLSPIDKSRPYEVWRVTNLTPDQQIQILNWAAAHVGEWYDLPLLFFGILRLKHTEICTTYVLHAFNAANKQLIDDRGLISPDILIGSNLIHRII